MNCEKNYNHTLSRVRACAHSRSFCLFAVTSVTAVSVNGSFSVACVFVCAIFNNKTIRVFKFRLTCQQKSRFVLLHFAKFLPSFPPISSLGVTLVTAKKQHRCWNARYTYARGKCSMRFFPFSCSDLLSPSLRFCADNKLQSDYFDKPNYQIRYKYKIKCQFFAIFSLLGSISPHIHIGAHDGGVHHFPFSFTAKAKLIYKSCLLLVVLRQERKKLREVFDNVRRDRFIYGLWRPFFPTKPNGFAP